MFSLPFFGEVSNSASVSGTSAVVVGKTNYVSLRVTFAVFSEPGYTPLIIFPNGTQKKVSGVHDFEVFLPKTEPEPVYGPARLHMVRDEECVFVTDQEPIDVAVVSNVDESFFTYNVGPAPNGEIMFFWFKIQGNARVTVFAIGVTI